MLRNPYHQHPWKKNVKIRTMLYKEEIHINMIDHNDWDALRWWQLWVLYLENWNMTSIYGPSFEKKNPRTRWKCHNQNLHYDFVCEHFLWCEPKRENNLFKISWNLEQEWQVLGQAVRQKTKGWRRKFIAGRNLEKIYQSGCEIICWDVYVCVCVSYIYFTFLFRSSQIYVSGKKQYSFTT